MIQSKKYGEKRYNHCCECDDLSSDEDEALSRSPRPYHTMPCHTMPVCVSATVHTPVRRGGCTGSDPGLTRGMATLIRVCERGTRCMSRA